MPCAVLDLAVWMHRLARIFGGTIGANFVEPYIALPFGYTGAFVTVKVCAIIID